MESPEADPNFRHFPERPSQVFIDSVKTHLAQTGQPETFAGLYHAKLPKDEPFIILAPIEINLSARPDGTLAPCPMCHQTNKFKDGRLVYLHQQGAVAVIGNECASQDTNREANREYQLRETKRMEEDYLIRVVPRLSQRFVEVGSVMSTCAEADDFLRAFRRDGEPFFEALSKARASGGQLVVTEEIKSSGDGPSGLRASGSNIQTRDHMVGILRGQVAVNPSFDPKGTLDGILSTLNNSRCKDEEASIDYITSLSDKERAATVRALKKAERDFTALLDRLSELKFFFGDRNLQTVNAWAGHTYSAFTFEMAVGSAQSDGRRRIEAKGGGRYFHHLIGPAVWENHKRLASAVDQ